MVNLKHLHLPKSLSKISRLQFIEYALIGYLFVYLGFWTKSSLFLKFLQTSGTREIFVLLSIIVIFLGAYYLIKPKKINWLVLTLVYTLCDLYMHSRVFIFEIHFNKIILYSLWIITLGKFLKMLTDKDVIFLLKMNLSMIFLTAVYFKFAKPYGFTWELFLEGRFEIFKAVLRNSLLVNFFLDYPVIVSLIKICMLPYEILLGLIFILPFSNKTNFYLFFMFHLAVFMSFDIVMSQFIFLWFPLFFPMKLKDDDI